MKDCDRDIRDYHREQVALKPSQRQKLEDRRDSNRNRLRSGPGEERGPRAEEVGRSRVLRDADGHPGAEQRV